MRARQSSSRRVARSRSPTSVWTSFVTLLFVSDNYHLSKRIHSRVKSRHVIGEQSQQQKTQHTFVRKCISISFICASLCERSWTLSISSWWIARFKRLMSALFAATWAWHFSSSAAVIFWVCSSLNRSISNSLMRSVIFSCFASIRPSVMLALAYRFIRRL